MVSLPQYQPVVSTVPMAQRLKDPPDSHFSTLTILGDKLIPINLIKDMWETQPYVEEISVEFWPFLNFLTSDRQGCRTHTHGRARAHTHTNIEREKQFPHCHCFLWNFEGDKVLINPEHWTRLFWDRNRFPCTQTHIYWYAPYCLAYSYSSSLRPMHRTVRLAWFSCSAHTVIPHYLQMPIKKNPIY